jgi:ABC-type dipeptide/oligopeptide/nickel transport system permease subunit
MKYARHIAIGVLLLTFALSLAAGLVAPAPYSRQFREAPNAPPSSRFLLGTDELGRDRFSRLLYGTRISLLLAPTAALLATLLAAIVGVAAGSLGGWWERSAVAAIDLFLSLPWFFLLITVRAVLPLNVSPLASVCITFALLGMLGWAASARVLCAGARSLRNAGFVVQARAAGTAPMRVLAVHILPNLKPVLWAQFWISIPLFILTEANLSLLGLGVAEPLPSWGSLLRDLESYSDLATQPWRLVPLLLLVVVVSAFQFIHQEEEFAL